MYAFLLLQTLITIYMHCDFVALHPSLVLDMCVYKCGWISAHLYKFLQFSFNLHSSASIGTSMRLSIECNQMKLNLHHFLSLQSMTFIKVMLLLLLLSFFIWIMFYVVITSFFSPVHQRQTYSFPCVDSLCLSKCDFNYLKYLPIEKVGDHIYLGWYHAIMK